MATIGIVTSNMLNNCVKVYTAIDKPICSVLQTEVHSNILPDHVCKICTDKLFVPFSPPLLVVTGIVVDLIR